MAERIPRNQVAEKATIHLEAAIVARPPTTVDRTFELPTALYAWTAVSISPSWGSWRSGSATPA